MTSIDATTTTTPVNLAATRPLVIRRTRGLSSFQLQAVWEYRELLYFLVWRDLRVRYKQTALGVAWVLLQPVISMAVFTLLFGYLLQVPSGGVPYAVFAYTALLPWIYFSGSLTRSSQSLVASANLITKVYFLLIIPISGVLSFFFFFFFAAAAAWRRSRLSCSWP